MCFKTHFENKYRKQFLPLKLDLRCVSIYALANCCFVALNAARKPIKALLIK